MVPGLVGPSTAISGIAVDRARSAATTRSAVLACAVAGLVAGLVRAAYLFQLRGSLPVQVLIGDARAYDEWAWRIASGDWIGSGVFYQAPLYPYFLAAIYAVAGHDPGAARVVQAALGATSCAALAWAGYRFFSLRTGLVAGLLLALYPPAIFFDGLIQKAALDLWLTTLAVALLGEFVAGRRTRWLLASGAALGALMLSRENARLLPVVVALWLWGAFRDASGRRRVAWIAAFGAGVLLAIAPVAVRNYVVGGELILTTAQFGPNFYIGNRSGATGRYEPLRALRGDPLHEREDATALAAEALGRPPTPGEVSDYWYERTVAEIAASPASWLKLMAWKWLLTWNALEIADSEGMSVYADGAPLLRWLARVLHFGVLCPLAVLGAWTTRRGWRRLSLLYGLLLTSALAVTLFFVFARYRISMVAIVALFAAAGLGGLADLPRALRTGGWREGFAPGVVLALLAALAVNWPLEHLRDDALGYFNLGTALLDANRAPEAVAPLEHAIELQPDFAAAQLNLGLAKLAQQRLDEAAWSFERALVQDPGSAIARFNLAVVRVGQRRGAEAEEQLVAAIAADPRLVEARVLLARQMLSSGRARAAAEQLRAAAELKPLDPEIRRDLALAHLGTGDGAQAIVELREVVRLAPDAHGAAVRLAWLLATSDDEAQRDGAGAVALAERVVSALGAEDPVVLDTLAAGYAEIGRFAEAAALAERAAAAAAARGNPALAEQIGARASGYRQRRPHRERPRGGAR
jgi:4-amino-4-deoxy-L-arabinose transferase-like glycosyltransferase/Flp pilus assembly protein TadD